MFALKAKLRANGCLTVDEVENADVVVVNTCSVTSTAESKTGRLIRSISRDAPNARILVTGCFAQQHGEAVLKKYPVVTWVVGNADKSLISSIISGHERKTYLSDINTGTASAVFGEDSVLGPDESGRTRFSIKIQEGCDFKCAYCIVPSLRGPSRSAPMGRLIETFKRAVDMGYKEIVLTGTHIGQYRDNQYGQAAGGRLPSQRNSNLEFLLESLLNISGDYRIRLSSLDPRDLTPSLITLVGGEGRVCGHLHVSVQSLSADVLARMGRPSHQVDLFIDLLHTFRSKYPNCGLGGDFIVGHPGETDAMFEATLRNAERIGFTYGHVFRFSRRAGTAAAVMAGQISESVKKNRSESLRGILEKSRKNFLSLLFVRPLIIIIESESPTRGVSGNYIKVEVPASRAPKNSWMKAVLTGAVRGEYCIAEEFTEA
jgi:threonylcarbamoyladenosine tRNA methylthiotransferase MtaB